MRRTHIFYVMRDEVNILVDSPASDNNWKWPHVSMDDDRCCCRAGGCSGHLMRTSVSGSLTNTSPMHTCPEWVYYRALKTMATWRQMASVKRSVKSVWTGHGVCFLALFLNSIISHWQQIELRKWWRANTNSNNDWMIYRSDWFLCHHHLQNCQPITFTVFVFYIPAAQ